MNKKINFLIIALIVCFTNLYAQQTQDTLRENGKVFLIHKVKKGETLYGLSKTYTIPIEDIIKYNPQSENGIKARENIKIYLGEDPQKAVKEKKIETPVKDTPKHATHTVQAGETLYGISKKYNAKITDLQKINPGLTETLSIGQVINLPVPETEKALEPFPAIPSEKSKESIKKSSYKVYALIPLYTNNIHRIDTGTFKSLSDYDKYKSFDFIQFYEGLLLAAEDASKKGVPVKVYVEDINDLNTYKLQQMIQNETFADVDLIIGPFFSDGFSLLCEYAKNKNITLVNPFAVTFDECNARMYKVSASYEHQAKQIAEFISQNYPQAQIILVNNQSQEDIMKTQAYRTGMVQGFSNIRKISIKEVNYAKEGVGGIQAAINPNCENFVFTFFNGEINITNFIQRMYGLKIENVTLFAPSFWKEYNNIETEYFMALKTHYVDPFFVDYSNPNVIAFIDKFRERFEIEPTLETFAFQGYDITYFFLNALMEYGSCFGTEINEMSLPLLSTGFRFEPKHGQCMENTFIHIYKLDNYKFINAVSDTPMEQTTPTINPK